MSLDPAATPVPWADTCQCGCQATVHLQFPTLCGLHRALWWGRMGITHGITCGWGTAAQAVAQGVPPASTWP